MIERIIYDIISDKLDWYKADSGQRFERFLLNELQLGAAEAAKARIYFAGGLDTDGNTIEARPPNLVHGYAHTGGPFPCWALVLGSERESQSFLNEDALPVDIDGNLFVDPETGNVVDSKVRMVSYVYNVQVLTDHPDITLWYYNLLKRIILSSHHAFLDADIYTPTISGADLAPDPRYLPDDVFIRQLTIELEAEECWSEAQDGYGTTLSGIAVDDGEGVTAGVGSVDAGVTTYTPGE